MLPVPKLLADPGLIFRMVDDSPPPPAADTDAELFFVLVDTDPTHPLAPGLPSWPFILLPQLPGPTCVQDTEGAPEPPIATADAELLVVCTFAFPLPPLPPVPANTLLNVEPATSKVAITDTVKVTVNNFKWFLCNIYVTYYIILLEDFNLLYLQKQNHRIYSKYFDKYCN